MSVFLQLVRAVGENILAMNQSFWLRIATRADAATSAADREALTSLSRAVMILVDAMVKRADAQLTDFSKVLQQILSAAADENGAWSLPLTKNETAALSEVDGKKFAET